MLICLNSQLYMQVLTSLKPENQTPIAMISGVAGQVSNNQTLITAYLPMPSYGSFYAVATLLQPLRVLITLYLVFHILSV